MGDRIRVEGLNRSFWREEIYSEPTAVDGAAQEFGRASSETTTDEAFQRTVLGWPAAHAQFMHNKTALMESCVCFQ